MKLSLPGAQTYFTLSSFLSRSVLTGLTPVSFLQYMLHTTAKMISLKHRSRPCYLLQYFNGSLPLLAQSPHFSEKHANPLETWLVPPGHSALLPPKRLKFPGEQAAPHLKLPGVAPSHFPHFVSPAHPWQLSSTVSSSGKASDTADRFIGPLFSRATEHRNYTSFGVTYVYFSIPRLNHQLPESRDCLSSIHC